LSPLGYSVSIFFGLQRIYAAIEPARIKNIKLHTSASLMENIVRLAEYRKRRQPPKRAHAPVETAGQYFCTRCDADEFKLSATGMVHCAHCGALMRNLLVTPASSHCS
jgi:hypothetical protein